jgi:type IV secretion system protein TrbJ
VLVEQARARWRQSRSAYRESLEVTASVVSSARDDSASLDRLIADSQSAVGNLQVVQAGNQIEALQTEQLMQMEAMMAAHYRAEALERARQLAEAERGRARTRTFLGE